MKATPQQLGDQLRKAFSVTEFTAEQLWALTVFAKHVRLRARNNTAFNNLCNSAFPNARFRQVTKTHKDGTTYPGLSIEAVVNGQITVNDQEEGEE